MVRVVLSHTVRVAVIAMVRAAGKVMALVVVKAMVLGAVIHMAQVVAKTH